AALRLQRSVAAESRGVAVALNDLAAVQRARGRRRAEVVLHRATLAVSERLVAADAIKAGDPEIAFYQNNLGAALLETGVPGAAEGSLRRGLEIRRAAFDATNPRHPSTVSTAGWLVSCLLVLDLVEGGGARQDEARRLCDAYGLDWDKQMRLAEGYAAVARGEGER
ncbi:MAG: tetratricopeptide repeat protein, partial [Pseudomonadota bacterium]